MAIQSAPVLKDQPMPQDTTDDLSKVIPSMGKEFPEKLPTHTITLTNNTDHTVYPFLYATNDAAQCTADICSIYNSNNPGSIYDPLDSWNEDYRGYIGYFGEDGNHYLGIPAGQTMTLNQVPLVFWDACRIYVAGDSEYLITDAIYQQANPPINPYQYYVQGDGVDTQINHQPSGTLSPSGLTALVMWYHAKVATAPANDARAQLLEFTIRNPWQQKYVNSKLSDGDIGPLINYDVSYVDTIFLPVAMEATDVPDQDGTRKPYGWIGASQKEADFQQAFQNFLSSDPALNGLGKYFADSQGNSRGYTQYNTPPDVLAAANSSDFPAAPGIKLPSGAQAIGDSPFVNHPSSYDPTGLHYMLVSGGDGPIWTGVNTTPATTSSATVQLTFNAGADGVIQKHILDYGIAWGKTNGGMDVTCGGDTQCIQDGPIPAETKLISYTVDATNPNIATAVLSQSLKANPSKKSYSFTYHRPVMDYVSSAMLALWYSWAKYYLDHNQVEPQTYAGSLTGDLVLTFTNPVPAKTLVPGMKVTGTGIPSDSDGSLCTITAITPDDGTPIQSVTLSELVTSGSSDNYTFTGPLPIAGYDHPLVKTFPLTFNTDATSATKAMAFAQTVYQSMSAMSTIPPNPNDKNPPPVPMQILYNVIGCNVGQIPHIGQDLTPKDGHIATEITIKIKSALRGVPDFTDTDKWPEKTWYPDPSQPDSSQAPDSCPFNVYNLDPFVWFVHKKLGLSGYGFSVDDDVADVGANGATNLAIAITGLNGLPNTKQWSPDKPYGV